MRTNNLIPPWHVLLIFIVPALVIYTVFMVYPLFDSMRLALYQQQADGTHVYVGLENIARLFNDTRQTEYDERFRNALFNTFHFFGIFMAFQNPIGLFLAALLSIQGLRYAGFFRAVLFTPTTMSIVIIGWIWTLMLNPIWGIVSDFFENIGLEWFIPSAGWLGDPAYALSTVALVGVWQWIGMPMILFLASLVGINQDLIEAAKIDGATGWDVFWRIKFPLVLPTAGVVAVLTFTANFVAFDNVFVMQGTQAGPDFATDILGTFFYRVTFGGTSQLPNPSMGAAIATMIFFIILTGVLIYFFLIQPRLIRE
jgi:raffinose/stachyose/melibiose transport system permease protein